MSTIRAKRHLRSDSKTLVLLLHAFAGGPGELEGIRRHVIDPCIPDADVLVPYLPFGFPFAVRRMHATTEDLVALIEQQWSARLSQGRPYERIILVGHSGGSLLARAVFLNASGFDSLASKPNARPWAAAIERIVLLAGVNRGWSMDTPIGLGQRFKFALGDVVAIPLITFGQAPSIFDVRRGAPFLTALRLDWLRMKQSRPHGPLVIQLLGTQDDIVNPEDNLDFATGADFSYIEVPLSGHGNIIDVAPTRKGKSEKRAREERNNALKHALCATAEQLKTDSISLALLSRERAPDPPDPKVQHVVMVLHGIRDYGFWSQKIARQIRQLAAKRNETGTIAVLNPTYGYFPILPFLLPHVRRAKVEWLMDKLVDVKRLYPNARISYIGHSNGTYLLAGALKAYPFFKFHRIVFAGSVVRRDFPWSDYIGKQVSDVVNLVATGDWVVASVPKGVQALSLLDLGSAGHDGFSHPAVKNLTYVSGGHGAGIGEGLWDDIAKLVLDQAEFDASGNEDFRPRRAWWAILLGWSAPALLLGSAAVLLGIFYVLVAAIAGLPVPQGIADTMNWKALKDSPGLSWLALVLYLAVLRFIAVRF